jgi:hypothetical protein
MEFILENFIFENNKCWKMYFQKHNLYAFKQKRMLLRREVAENEAMWEDCKERLPSCCSIIDITLSYSVVMDEMVHLAWSMDTPFCTRN